MDIPLLFDTQRRLFMMDDYYGTFILMYMYINVQ